MKVVILAGGYGTRLSEETEVLPKPMIEVGGKPLLWHIMKLFSAQGFNEFIVALGYKGEAIKRYFLHYRAMESDLHIDLATGATASRDRSREDWKIELVDTGHNSLTGGRLKRLAPYLNERFFLTYGDGLSDVDLSSLLEAHKTHGRLATVTAVRPPQRFGALQVDGARVRAFNEKRGPAETWINGGFFVLEPEALDYIDGDSTAWEREPCERLASKSQLHAYFHSGYWQCVDTLHELRLLRDLWSQGQAPWKIWD